MDRTIIVPCLLACFIGCAVAADDGRTTAPPSGHPVPPKIKGNVSYTLLDSTESIPVKVGIPIPPISLITTEKDSFVDLCFGKGIHARLLPKSTMLTNGKETNSLTLNEGEILLLAKERQDSNPIEIKSESQLVGLRAPGEYEARASGDTSVYKGLAVWIDFEPMNHATFLIKEGQGRIGKGPREPVDLPDDAYESVRSAFDELRSATCDTK